jgi:hypothetical protein
MVRHYSCNPSRAWVAYRPSTDAGRTLPRHGMERAGVRRGIDPICR